MGITFIAAGLVSRLASFQLAAHTDSKMHAHSSCSHEILSHQLHAMQSIKYVLGEVTGTAKQFQGVCQGKVCWLFTFDLLATQAVPVQQQQFGKLRAPVVFL